MGWPIPIIIGDKRLRERLREAQKTIRNFYRREKPELEHQLRTMQDRISDLGAELAVRPAQEDLIKARGEITLLETRLQMQAKGFQSDLTQLRDKSENERTAAIRELEVAHQKQLQAHSEESVEQIKHILDVYFSNLRIHQDQANAMLKDTFVDESSIAFAPQENPIWAALIERVRIVGNASRPFYIFVPQGSLAQYLGVVPSRAKEVFIVGMPLELPEDPKDFRYSRLKHSIRVIADGVHKINKNGVYTPEVYLGETLKQRDGSYLHLLELARCIDTKRLNSEESRLLSYASRHGLTQQQSLALVLHLGAGETLGAFEGVNELRNCAYMVELQERYIAS